MTPGKVMALMEKRIDDMELRELPIANLACLYANSHRNMGDPEKGIAASPVMKLEEFQFFRRRGDQGLVTKDSPEIDGPQNWLGAVANRYSFEVWGGCRTPDALIWKG